MGGGLSSVNVPRVELPEDFTAVVTGGHQGLGYEAVKYLALLGARVVLACDSESKAKAALLRIQADAIEIRGALDSLLDHNADDSVSSAGGSDPSIRPAASADDLRVEYLRLDQSSLDSVTHFCETYKAKGYPLHLLICSDGVVELEKGFTEDGFENHFQRNYLGHFFLTLQLTPIMKATEGDCRIVIVSSKDHQNGELNLKTIQGKGQYNKSKSYANSKYYQIMHMYALHRRLAATNVSVYAVHGGMVDSVLKKNMDNPAAWSSVYNVGRSLGRILNNLSKNVTNLLSVSLSPQLRDLQGSYFVEGVPISPSLKAKDAKEQEVLWRYSLQCLEGKVTEEMVDGLTITSEDLEKELEGDK